MKYGKTCQNGEPGRCAKGKPTRQYSLISSDTKAWKRFVSNIPRVFPRIWNRGNSSKSAIRDSKSSSASSSALGLSGSCSNRQAAQLEVLTFISWKQRRWNKVPQQTALWRRCNSSMLKSPWQIKQTPNPSSSGAKPRSLLLLRFAAIFDANVISVCARMKKIFWDLIQYRVGLFSMPSAFPCAYSRTVRSSVFAGEGK